MEIEVYFEEGAVIKAADQCAVKRVLKDPPEIEVRTVSE